MEGTLPISSSYAWFPALCFAEQHFFLCWANQNVALLRPASADPPVFIDLQKVKRRTMAGSQRERRVVVFVDRSLSTVVDAFEDGDILERDAWRCSLCLSSLHVPCQVSPCCWATA